MAGRACSPRLAVGLLGVLTLAGCAGPEASPFADAASDPDTTPAMPVGVPAPGEEGEAAWAPWSRSAVHYQLRLGYRAPPPPDDLTPGVSDWNAAPEPVGEAVRQIRPQEEPGLALLRVAEVLGLADRLGSDEWEVTFRVHRNEDLAEGAIHTWGTTDDAVAGTGFRVSLAREEEGWVVRGMEERVYCRRGVTREGLCI